MDGDGVLRRVDAVTVRVPDLDAGLQFYRDALGHQLIWRNDDVGQAGLALPDGDSELVLTTHQDCQPNWLVDDVPVALARITAAGGRTMVEPSDIPVGRVAVAHDPFGNPLTLVDLSRGRYRTDRDGRVVAVEPPDESVAGAPRVRQLRVVVEAAHGTDYDDAVRFFRDVLGLPELAAFAEGGDDRVAILDAGRATLELATPTHRVAIDEVETGGRVQAPRIRLAFEVADTAGTADELVDAGAELLAPPVMTPWRSINSRLAAPADLQITLFQETETPEERAARPGFGHDDGRE